MDKKNLNQKNVEIFNCVFSTNFPCAQKNGFPNWVTLSAGIKINVCLATESTYLYIDIFFFITIATIDIIESLLIDNS